MDPKASLSHDRSLSQTPIKKEQTTSENTRQTRVGGSHVKEEPSPDHKVDEHGNHNQEDPQIKDEPGTEQGTDDRSPNHGGLRSANGSTAVPQTAAHQGSSFDTAQQARGETTHYTGAGSQQTNNNSHDDSRDAVGPTGVKKDHLD